MHKILFFFKNIIFELIVIFLLIFTINNYLGNVKQTIKADGIGYYDYLPSVFIYHDINRKDILYKSDTSFYSRINKLKIYSPYKGYLINKYPSGSAILMAPFFLYTYYTFSRIDYDTNPFDYPYQHIIFYAAIFYFFLTLFFLKKLLKLYHIKLIDIVFLQILSALATLVTIQVNNDCSGSHIYSLFVITLFLYFVKSYFVTKKINHFVLACIFLGLIFLIRNINIIIIFFIPFLAGSFIGLKTGISQIFKYPVKLVIAIISMLVIVSIQSILWYLQVGEFIVYSYTDEGFNFLSPAFLDVLFSYRKGLFVYTPVLLISLFGLIRLAINRQYYLLFTWLTFFMFINYIFSSWWCWYYGCSFGMRVYIDFFSIFFVLFAILINDLNKWFKIPIVLISMATIPLNLIQTYQYKEYILSWESMNEKSYWEVFLKQEDKYKGYLWKRTYDIDRYYNIAKTVFVKKIIVPSNKETTLININSNVINQFNKVSLLQIKFDNEFSSENDSRFSVSIKDSITNIYCYSFNPPIIFFAEKGFNKFQTGVYNLEVPINPNPNQIISINVFSPNKKDSLTNFKVTFFTLK